MDEDHDIQEEKSAVLLPRHRSPTFSKVEVKMLINLIDKYKSVILNKSTNTAACHAKEITWAKITKMYNNQGFKHKRHTECLKVKWDNLKKEARKLSKNLIEINHSEFSDVISHIVGMICEAENNSEIEMPPQLDEDTNVVEFDDQTTSKNEDVKFWEENNDKESEHSTDSSHENERLKNRSMNFSPEECRLLLKCVRSEKRDVLNKENTGKANTLKAMAWSRITDAYNSQSPNKRTTKVLRTKFCNMKKVVKKVNIMHYIKGSRTKHMKLVEESSNNHIKSEPLYEMDDEPMNDDVDEDYSGVHNLENGHVDYAPDPLSTVLNGDSGIDSIDNGESINPLDNKEIVKLKKELIKCQIENAKLERKRLENAMKAEAGAQEAKTTEMALRLRAARLKAVAAEIKLPPGHPALSYTAEEARAQTYINQYRI